MTALSDTRASETGATVAAALAEAARRLAGAGVEEPRREATVLLGHVLGLDRAALFARPDRPLAPREAAAFAAAVARRCRREPSAYVTGAREFWSLDFRVTPATLIPRPDSETLVAAALDTVADRAATLEILDLGTGSGCLLAALLVELPRARGLGVDIDPRAAAVAAGNLRRLGLGARARVAVGDWGAALAGRFDLVVCNPPYVPAGEIDGLAPEVAAFEPRRALAGGDDGLAAYRRLAPEIARLLAPGGAAVVEIGAGQAAAVGAIFAASRLAVAARRRDLARIERCLVLRHAGIEKNGPSRKKSLETGPVLAK